jgi:2,3-bisphosphoglycerate-independent phosphoglycerate mutase
VNYANADTIAHTGNFEAPVEAVRVLDKELGKILKVAQRPDVALLITADHGNIEQLRDPMTGRTQTQHDPSPVPFYLVAEEFKQKKFVNYDSLTLETLGILSDVAPTILELLGIQKPPEMTGDSLLGKMV